MFVLIAILVLGVLIFVHELGHFTVAKLSGMPVDEFSMGFGPEIISRQWGETKYSLRSLPLGGYNKIAGMDVNDDRPNGYNHKPLLARFGVILAGSLFNMLFAVLIFVFVFSVIGVQTPSGANVIGDVMVKSPAYSAGLQPGDRISMVDGQQTPTWDQMASAIQSKGSQPVKLSVERKGRSFSMVITPRYDPSAKSRLIGVVSSSIWVKQGFFLAVKSGLQESYDWSAQILQSLVQLFTGKVHVQDLSGPVGIVLLIDNQARAGLGYLLMLTGVLGINLAIVNLLPIPALDGSRLIFLLVEGVRGKPIDPEREGIIHLVGFALLMCLILVVTYNDIVRLVSGG